MLRRLGFPAGTCAFALFDRDAGIKMHPSYKAAKSGDVAAALALVTDLAGDWLFLHEKRFKPGAVFVAPHAKEASGDNAITQTKLWWSYCWRHCFSQCGPQCCADPRAQRRPFNQGAISK